jgi:hypothetical protein
MQAPVFWLTLTPSIGGSEKNALSAQRALIALISRTHNSCLTKTELWIITYAYLAQNLIYVGQPHCFVKKQGAAPVGVIADEVVDLHPLNRLKVDAALTDCQRIACAGVAKRDNGSELAHVGGVAGN